MKSAAVFALGLLLPLGPGSARAQTTVLLSLDGFANGYLADPGLKTIKALRDEGTSGPLTPPYPSLTFPSHTTIATGCPVAKHGIVANKFVDKKRGEFDYLETPDWNECEPLWVAAERQGVRTATFDWPVSYGSWHGSRATYHPAAFELRKRNREILDDLVASLSLDREHRPRLLMTRLGAMDGTGHRYGPASPQTKRRVLGIDRELDRFRSRLARIPGLGPVTLFVVSDHGMAEVKEVLSLSRAFADKKIPGIAAVEASIFYLYLWDPLAAREVFGRLGEIAGARIFLASDWPAVFGKVNPRMGDLIGVTEPPRMFRWRQGSEEEPDKGAHGYDPALPEMKGIFIAWGAGIAKGRKIEGAEAIQMAATVSRSLNIQPPKDNEGTPLDAIFTSD
ncbi:MAG: ectonucleotide pyrophosphatase/phosphodiesterase [Pseudomonadota bacterium]